MEPSKNTTGLGRESRGQLAGKCIIFFAPHNRNFDISCRVSGMMGIERRLLHAIPLRIRWLIFYNLVQFYEKRLRKAGWVAKAEEKVSWEQWMLTVTLLAPCNKMGKFSSTMFPRKRKALFGRSPANIDVIEKTVMLKKIESQLEKTLREIIHIAGHNKDHIPPITSQEPNPFPYSIIISPKEDTWGTRIGIFWEWMDRYLGCS